MCKTRSQRGWIWGGCLTVMFSAWTAAAAELPAVADLPKNPEPPAALIMLDGTPVKTPEEWFNKRRPELIELFKHYMFGYAPESPGIVAKVTQTDNTVLGGKATLQEIEIGIQGLPETAPKLRVALFTPNHVPGPVPVFLGINRCGNHAVIDHPSITIFDDLVLSKSCPKERGCRTDFWALENTIDRGYGFATFHESDPDPDLHNFNDGLHPHFPMADVAPEHRWGTIAAWAWGLQRAIDYLETNDRIDPKRICLIGHSRRGKTVLWTAAIDQRVALVVPHQSGTGGAALSRNNDQETVERINRVFPHWFNDTFPKFGNNEAQLPFDQHLLMALVAPRALFDTEGIQDHWANFDSALQAVRLADEVYKFVGTSGIVGSGVIQPDESVTPENVGNLVQFRRDTKHTLEQSYWDGILDFADIYFARQAATAEQKK